MLPITFKLATLLIVLVVGFDASPSDASPVIVKLWLDPAIFPKVEIKEPVKLTSLLRDNLLL